MCLDAWLQPPGGAGRQVMIHLESKFQDPNPTYIRLISTQVDLNNFQAKLAEFASNFLMATGMLKDCVSNCVRTARTLCSLCSILEARRSLRQLISIE